jgi:hypothetical protein
MALKDDQLTHLVLTVTFLEIFHIPSRSTFRGYLTRKKLMKQNLLNYKPGVRDLQWAREYKDKLKQREVSRHRRNQGVLRQ